MFHRFFAAFLCASFVSVAHAEVQPAPVYKLDTGHTRVTFFVNHLGFSEMPGFFHDIEGTVQFDPNDVMQARLDVTINAKKVTVGHKVLDEKLQGPDFFYTSKYPTIRFRSTYIEKTGLEDGLVTGALTLLGVTRPVTLKVHFNKRGWNSYANQDTVGFSATGVISRSEFGMTKYLPDVGDKVKLQITAEAFQPRMPNSTANTGVAAAGADPSQQQAPAEIQLDVPAAASGGFKIPPKRGQIIPLELLKNEGKRTSP